MRLWSDSFDHGEPIPTDFAFVTGADGAQAAPNKNPHLAWADVPEGTRSLVLVVHDRDAPSEPDDVNQAGRSISEDLERIEFFHGVYVDFDPEGPALIAEGELSDGVTAGGKPGPDHPRGRAGVNNFGHWFTALGNDAMQGTYFGYDGPCPPFNDSVVHHYFFTLYATDLERCPVEGEFSGQDVIDAIEDHVLAKAAIMGTYALNPQAVDLG